MVESPEARPADYRRLMKKVEQVVTTIERSDEIAATIHSLIDAIIGKFRDELGLSGGRLYRREGDDYVLMATFADAHPVPEGTRLPADYPPIEAMLREGTVDMDLDDPRVDPGLEQQLGVARFAAIEVGEEAYLLAFDVAPGHHREDVLFSLGVLRHSINQKLRQERMEEVFREARKIQASILPRRAPTYHQFDIHGATRTVESVGGDFYDFIPITEKMLGLAIADVSGHGLPAALQVRDIYMGLRMGLARDFKIVRTVERLNGIIHQSTLTSRFVSVFYGELEPSGVFIYVNAGHPAPFHLPAEGPPHFLTEGGPVLGPLPQASYERGFVHVRAGDLLVLYTDGVIEASRGHDAEREEYGAERLAAAAARLRGRPAREIVDELFADIDRFTGGEPPEDDRTLVVVSAP
ncbi:MAG: PP2C family protein-serine/threonine phosphatase [Holophagales bacterium]|nr:MAG: PP2C family protein-serine/threonine phosphatase [Holophagales bacterium]